MKIVYSPLHQQHRPTYEVYDGVRDTYAEVPERIEVIKDALVKENLGILVAPKEFSARFIEEIHHRNYIKFVASKSKELKSDDNFFASNFIMDTYTPMTGETYQAAKVAVDVALTGAALMKDGEKLVYALSRPPGHHAGHVNMGGYCYFNNAAIAANYLSEFGKVAILDIDYHHGNGTQQAFYSRDDVFYVSLHADPEEKFPYISGFEDETGRGEGKGYTKNYPLPLDTTEEQWIAALKKAIKNIQQFSPSFLVVSAGFDTYINDPIGKLGLDISSYSKVGGRIAALQLPTLVIQEGGYNVAAFGVIATSFVKGLQSDEI